VAGSLCRLIGFDLTGRKYESSRLLSLEWERSLDSPADGFTATLLVADHWQELARLQFWLEEELLFEGMVDEMVYTLSADGLTLKLDCRSYGGLLLDNEAKPAVYLEAKLRDVYNLCIDPYRHFSLGILQDPILGQFTVSKGINQWEAFSRFCRMTLGRSPWVDGENTVCLLPVLSGARHLFSNTRQGGVPYLRLTEEIDRYSVVSEVYVRAKDGLYSVRVEAGVAETSNKIPNKRLKQHHQFV